MSVAATIQYDVNAGISADVEPAVAAAAGLSLVGYAIRESAGTPAAAAVNIVHGATVAGGDALIPIELAADASDLQFFPAIPMADGISIEVVTGTVDLTLFYQG